MKPKVKAESRPSPAVSKIIDGALWAVGAGAVGFLLRRLFPQEPTVVVLANNRKRDDDTEEE